MKTLSTVLLTGLSMAYLGQAAPGVVVSDTFDYPDTAAMLANWGSPTGLSLDTASGNPAPAGAHDGQAAAHSWIGSSFSLTPSDAEPVVLSADLWYSGNNNQRNSVGLRNGANPLFEMGFYNGTGANGLAVRILSFAGNPSWTGLLTYTELGTGVDNAKWIRLESTFKSTSVAIRYDLGADGTWDGTYDSSGAGYGNPFVDLRFGGPSALSSAGGGFLVDNINLAVIPEPSVTALALLGGLGLLIGRFRRS